MPPKKHTSLDRVLGRLDTLDAVNLTNLVQRLAGGLYPAVVWVISKLHNPRDRPTVQGDRQVKQHFIVQAGLTREIARRQKI